MNLFLSQLFACWKSHGGFCHTLVSIISSLAEAEFWRCLAAARMHFGPDLGLEHPFTPKLNLVLQAPSEGSWMVPSQSCHNAVGPSYILRSQDERLFVPKGECKGKGFINGSDVSPMVDVSLEKNNFLWESATLMQPLRATLAKQQRCEKILVRHSRFPYPPVIPFPASCSVKADP